jgi:hypothetical protein
MLIGEKYNISDSIMSPSSIVIAIVFLILFCLGFYKYSTNEDGGEIKKMKILKRIFAILIILGFFSLYSQTKDTSFKGLWLICIVLLLNVYTVIYSTGKCNYPDLYKIKLILWTSFIILFMSIGMWYGTFGSVFGFELGEEVKGAADIVTGGTPAVGALFKGKVDCPSPSSSDYNDKFNELKKKDKEQARKCLAYYQLLDTEKGIYA